MGRCARARPFSVLPCRDAARSLVTTPRSARESDHVEGSPPASRPPGAVDAHARAVMLREVDQDLMVA